MSVRASRHPLRLGLLVLLGGLLVCSGLVPAALGGARPAAAAGITFDAVSSSSALNVVSTTLSLTFSHTIGTGADRVLLVGIAYIPPTIVALSAPRAPEQ